jgi:hypothetical protein
LTLAFWLNAVLSPSLARAEPHALLDVSAGFVPIANDVPLMLSVGLQVLSRHEVWFRGGYMAVGDDKALGLLAAGYRFAMWPDQIVRPIFGGLAAWLPESCTHDHQGNPSCERVPLGVFAATAGVRFDVQPTLGIFVQLHLGIDTYPNPFGMFEAGITFVLPENGHR